MTCSSSVWSVCRIYDSLCRVNCCNNENSFRVPCSSVCNVVIRFSDARCGSCTDPSAKMDTHQAASEGDSLGSPAFEQWYQLICRGAHKGCSANKRVRTR